MAKKVISSGSPPIVWSTVQKAFDDINANFTELYTSLGVGGVVDFSDLPTSLIPRSNDVYDLGSPANRWKTAFFGSDGISIGGSNIEDINGAISLPSGSTVGGQLIKDPAEVAFGTIAVTGQSSVVANSASSTLNFLGDGVSITTNSTSDTITFSNSGVRSVSAGAGVSVSGTSSNPVINATISDINGGLGISVSDAAGVFTIENSGIVSLEAGTGITIGARDPVTGKVVITNQSPASGISSFRTVKSGTAANWTDPGYPLLAPSFSAQNSADTVGYSAGAGISIGLTAATGVYPSLISITNTGVRSLASSSPNISVSSSTGSVTLSFDNRIDIIGSVFADDSTMLVDGTNGQIVGPINSFADGNSILMNPSNGVIIGGTAGASVIGAAGAPVYIGSGPSGSTTGIITIGHGLNSVIVNGTLTATLSGNVTGNLTGNVNGSVDGQLLGSVYADNSTLLVDGVDGKVVGPVETTTVIATAYMQTGVYNGLADINNNIIEPAKGMIVFNDSTNKFMGYDGNAWIDLN